MSKAGTLRFIWLPTIGLYVLMVVHQGWKQPLIVFGVSLAVGAPIALILHRRNVKRSRNEDPVNRRADLFDF
jgi:integral membrane sensor domain MASE1